ncbi:MAG: COX15/CtaA family protein [Planctomycetota bacterium]
MTTLAQATTPIAPSITDPHTVRITALVGPALTAGLATAVAMWVVWWFTHLPSIAAAPPLTLGLLLVTNIAVLTWISAKAGRAAVWVGLGGGIIAALLNLLILGSVLGEQAGSTFEMAEAANRFRAEAPAIFLGFLLASSVVGLLAGALARGFTGSPAQLDGRTWLARYAGVLAVGFIPLLAIGGSVTSTESGMAVPDAVTTYGSVSFLFPISLMADPRIFLEHTHRLFGTLIGVATILLLVQTFLVRVPTRIRVMAIVLLVLVTLQGLLGIARVSAIVRAWPGFSAIGEPYWAALHGIKGQGVFAFAVWTAAAIGGLVATSESMLPERTAKAARGAGRLALFAVIALFIQLFFGALSRHTGSAHALWSHVGWALVVTIVVFTVAAILTSADRFSETGGRLRRMGTAVGAVVIFQFCLGFAALAVVGGGGGNGGHRPIPTADELALAPPIDTVEALFTTSHQTTGAILLGLVVLAAVRARHVGTDDADARGPAPADRQNPVPA